MKQCLLPPPPPDSELLWLPAVLPSPSEAMLLMLWQLLDIWEFWAVEAVTVKGKLRLTKRTGVLRMDSNNIFLYQEQKLRCPR